MSDLPETIPGLRDLVPGPDPATRERLAGRLASVAEAGRPAPGRRRWTLAAVIALVAVLVATIVLVPLLHTGHPPRPGGPSIPTTTLRPSGSVPPFRAGTVVPNDDLLAFSFWSDRDGEAVAAPPSETQDEQLAVTRDGGRTWTAAGGLLPQGGPDWSSISWSTSGLGFVWSELSVLRTTDAGRHWRQLPTPPGLLYAAGITSVSVAGGSLWAVYSCSSSCGSSHWPGSSVWSWTVAGGWHEVLSPAQLGDVHVAEVLRTGHLDLVLAFDRSLSNAATAGRAGAATGNLLVSSDGGATWSRAPLPCGGIVGHDGNSPQQPVEVTPYPDSVAVARGVPRVAAALECVGDDFSDVQPASLWTLDALGRGGRWRLRADHLHVVDVLYPHVPAAVGAARWGPGSSLVETRTSGALWMDGGRGAPVRSLDEGVTWSVVPSLNPPLGILSQLQFVDPTHGWCLFADQAAEGFYATTDGGTTWHRLP